MFGVGQFWVLLFSRAWIKGAYARIRPAVLQVESHPYLTQEVLVRYCGEQEIAVTAFSPLGAQSYHAIGMADAGENLLNDAPMLAAADAHGKTSAQGQLTSKRHRCIFDV